MSPISKATWWRTIAIVGILFLSSIGIPARSAQAAIGILTYVRFDWYRQSNGTYNIVMVYCVDAESNAVYWGETSPTEWRLQQLYGRQRGCSSCNLFYQVLVNDQLYASILTNPRPGDSDEEANFRLSRTSTGYTCALSSTYRNGLRRVNTSTYPCAWTK